MLLDYLIDVLSAHTVSGCSDWTQRYRVIKGRKFTFARHPWAKDMHDSEAPHNVGMKAAQMGFTETVLNRTFFMIDVRKVDTLYVLPSKIPDALDFSAGRFDPALEESTHLADLFTDVKNTGHKRAGAVSLYVRGSRSRGGLKSIPVGFLVLDERAEMLQESVNLALERLSGQEKKQIWEISTPTIPNKNIDLSYQESNQQHFTFPCPLCDKHIELLFPDCVLLEEKQYICPECRQIITPEAKMYAMQKGTWTPTRKSEIAGWQIGQMYSNAISPAEFCKDAIAAENDPVKAQEFHNSKLGVPYIAKGAKLNQTDFAYHTETAGTFTTLGIDVGTFLNAAIVDWQLPNSFCPDINTIARGNVIYADKFHSFDFLDKLMYDYQIRAAVIDSQPERRKAKEFADKFPGYVKLCYYAQGQNSKAISLKNDEDHLLLVDRTSWLDLLTASFKAHRLKLPTSAPEELEQHLLNLVKVYKTDKLGNPAAYFDSTGPDHYAHALNYAQIALPLAANIQTGRDIGSFL